MPARVHELWHSEEDWAYHTVPQAHAAAARCTGRAGKVLGGSGSLNGMVQVRGAPADYDSWAYAGNAGWRWADVLPIFVAMEDFDRGASQLHGVGGPMHIHTLWEPSPIHRAIEHAAAQVGDPAQRRLQRRDPGRLLLRAVDHHRRAAADSSASGYLRPVRGDPRLASDAARTHATAADRARALRRRRVRAGRRAAPARAPRREVILAAGTIESPRLLMLSGIGPAEHLRALGIDVVADLPGVGENLHDHLLAPVICSRRAADRRPARRALVRPRATCSGAAGPASPPPTCSRSSSASPPISTGWRGPRTASRSTAGSCVRSAAGRLRLSLRRPRRAAAHRPAHPQLRRPTSTPLEVGDGAVPRDRRRGRARANGARASSTPARTCDDSAALRDYIRRAVVTYHHQVGTCRMGIDEGAVVDPRLRVHGVDGLRVADASIMPAVTTGNTNAAVGDDRRARRRRS